MAAGRAAAGAGGGHDGDEMAAASSPSAARFGRDDDEAPPARASSAKSLDLASVALGAALHDEITLDVFETLRATFESADLDGGGSLDEDEFVAAFAAALGDGSESSGNDARLRQLFNRVDANADGAVDWDEFSTYVLLEGQAARELRALDAVRKYLPEKEQRVGVAGQSDPEAKHRDVVTSLTKMTSLRDTYATTSHDGTVRLWQLSSDGGVKYVRKVDLRSRAYLTAGCHLDTSGRLAVASHDRKVKILDKGWKVCGQLSTFQYAPLCMTSWRGGAKIVPGHKDMDWIAVGDDGGYVHVLQAIDMTDGEKAQSEYKVRFENKWTRKLHDDWVTSVQYVKEDDVIVSGSLDRTVKLVDVDPNALGARTRTLQGHKGGVNAVAWSPRFKLLLTASVDKTILLWNPLTSKPVDVLYGHGASISHLMLVESESQIISLDVEKNVRVWDFKSRACVQSFEDKTSYFPVNAIGALGFDHGTSRLLTASISPKLWKLTVIYRAASVGHNRPAVAVSVNPSPGFTQIASADSGGCVCVWDFTDGEIEYRFTDAHAVGGDADARLTAMTYDAAGRRVCVGASDGVVSVWNPSNGHRVKLCVPGDGAAEVTGLAHMGEGDDAFAFKRVAAVGWDHAVTFWDDDARVRVNPRRRMRGEKAHGDADVLCVAAAPPDVMATGDSRGDLLIWNVENGALRHKLPAPPLPKKLDDGHAASFHSAAAASYAPASDRAAESVVFLGRDLPKDKATPAVVAASYADGHARVWNVSEGRLVADFHAGHRDGESVMTIAADADGEKVVTGDAVGRVKLWDFSRITRAALAETFDAFGQDAGSPNKHVGNRRVMGRDDAMCVGYWQAHAVGACVSACQFFRAPAGGAPGETRGFFVTCGQDAVVSVWTDDGRHVGRFG